MPSELLLDLFGDNEDDAPQEEEPSSADYARLGRYAEFMVCAELTKLGYYVVHVDAPGFDLILSANSRTFRVQVKSSSTTIDGRRRWRCRIAVEHRRASGYRKRPITKEDADLLALFDHATGKTIFVPVQGNVGQITIPLSQVASVDTQATLLAALVGS